MENVQPCCRDLGWKNQDPTLSYEHSEIFTKDLVGVPRSRKPGQPGQPESYKEALRASSYEPG